MNVKIYIGKHEGNLLDFDLELPEGDSPIERVQRLDRFFSDPKTQNQVTRTFKFRPGQIFYAWISRDGGKTKNKLAELEATADEGDYPAEVLEGEEKKKVPEWTDYQRYLNREEGIENAFLTGIDDEGHTYIATPKEHILMYWYDYPGWEKEWTVEQWVNGSPLTIDTQEKMDEFIAKCNEYNQKQREFNALPDEEKERIGREREQAAISAYYDSKPSGGFTGD